MSNTFRRFALIAVLLAPLTTSGQMFTANAPVPHFDCPASGYFKPMYGLIGRNGGDGFAPTEAMSPCTPPAVKEAVDAVGMARSNYFSPLTLKGVTTAMFTATGSYALDGKASRPVEQLDFQIHYGLPGARLMVRDHGTLDIRAMNDEYGWKEVSEGGAASAAPEQLRELYALTKLTPFGALWSVVEAEGHAMVSQQDGKTVLRGTSPYDGLDVTIVLGADKRPESVKVQDGKTVYGATFADYIDGFEPEYLYVFPRQLNWTRNGHPLAALTVTAYKTNPYVAFPVPKNVPRAAANLLPMPPKVAKRAEGYYPPLKRISPFAAYDAAMSETPAAKLPTPRTADGRPDFSGNWGPIPSPAGGGGLRRPGTFEPDQAALQRASGWGKPIYKPELWSKVRTLDYGKSTDDPSYNCTPVGVPRQNAPNQIIQTSKLMVFIHLFLRARVIPLDGRALTKLDADMSTFDGVSVGKWEGDTLVVESVGFNDISWLQWQGYFHSERMKVIERLWRKGNLLFYNFTVDDPEVLQEPWTQGTMVFQPQPDSVRQIEADPCVVIPAGGDPYLRG